MYRRLDMSLPCETHSKFSEVSQNQKKSVCQKYLWNHKKKLIRTKAGTQGKYTQLVTAGNAYKSFLWNRF